MQFPLVSILMTAYNREQFIAEAIESVLHSSYKNFELIIVDDCSSDKTVEISRSFAKKDSRIKVYVNERNLGDYPNRNRAASHATGEYIMFVDSDDVLYKDGIEKCIETMQKFPSASFGIRYFYKDCEPFEWQTTKVIKKHFFDKPLLTIGPGGTIIHRGFFKESGGYPEKYGPANDMYFNLKVASQTPVVFIPFAFHEYRLHDGQEINNKYQYLYNNYLYLKDALRELPLPLESKQIRWLNRKNQRRFLVNAITYFLRTGDVNKTTFLVRKTSFSLKDCIEAVFH